MSDGKPRRPEPWERALGAVTRRTGGQPTGNAEGTPPSDPTDVGRYREAMVELIRRQLTLAGPSFNLGTILQLNAPGDPVPATSETALDTGNRIQIVTCERPELVGKEANIISLPDDEDPRMSFALLDGTVVLLRPFDSKVGKAQFTMLLLCEATANVAIDGRELEVKCPAGFIGGVGARVRVNMTTNSIVGLAPASATRGDVATVQAVLEDGRCEVSVRNNDRVVIVGESVGKVQTGDRVMLDASLAVITSVLEQNGMGFGLSSQTGVDWEDIGGQDEAVARMREIIEDAAENPEDYEYYKLDQANGFMVTGPPGTGKTLLCRAAATAMARVHGFDRPIGFLLARGPEFLESLVGKGEKKLRGCHVYLRRFYQEYGFRGMFVIDECEVVFKRRGSGISSDATDSLVNEQLGQTNRFNVGDPIIGYVTNRPDIMDEAIYRDERVDVFIHMDRPSQASATPIFAIYFAKHPLEEGESPASLSAYAASLLFDPRYRMEDKSEGATLGHVSSGAMIKVIVDNATRRAMKEGRPTKTRIHVGRRHIDAAIEAKYEEKLKNLGPSVRDKLLAALAEMRAAGPQRQAVTPQ